MITAFWLVEKEPLSLLSSAEALNGGEGHTFGVAAQRFRDSPMQLQRPPRRDPNVAKPLVMIQIDSLVLLRRLEVLGAVIAVQIDEEQALLERQRVLDS